MKNSEIFHISARKHRLWYSLEPPRRGGSNKYPQFMFSSKNKKMMYSPVNPSKLWTTGPRCLLANPQNYNYEFDLYLCLHTLWSESSMGGLVYTFSKILSELFKQRFSLATNILQHEHFAANCMHGCNPIMIDNFASHFNRTTVGRFSD